MIPVLIDRDRDGDFYVSTSSHPARVAAGNADHAVHLALAWLQTGSAETTVLIRSGGVADGGLSNEVVSESAGGKGVGVALVAAVTETIKQIDEDGFVIATVSRDHVLRMLLPQAASLDRLRGFHRSCPPDGDPDLLCLVGEPADVIFLRLHDLADPVRQ